MGGNALKKVNTIRIDPINYQRIKIIIMDKLKALGFVVSDIIEAPGKESYGDLDLLYWKDDLGSSNSHGKSGTDIKKIIKDTFNPNEMVSNGEVLSWDFENFQIDLIKCSSLEQMTYAQFYFSYGDLGSILGRFCNYHGLKIGHRGFWINVYECTIYNDKPLDVTRNFGEILLTSSPKETCEFLGLEYSKWLEGFQNLESIFNWIIKSKYFVAKIYQELNADHMRRAKIRPMYMKFLEFVGMNPLKNNDKPKPTLSKIRFNMQPEAIKYFNKENELLKIKKQIEFNQVVRTKFSGKKLLEKGIEGKKIGIILTALEEYVDINYKKTFDEWVYHTDQKEIDFIVEGLIGQNYGDNI
jgi:hypothetical protein